jgi:hypothetical protein
MMEILARCIILILSTFRSMPGYETKEIASNLHVDGTSSAIGPNDVARKTNRVADPKCSAA